jgi:glycosyltransferase involved in cell wall biosynthesis
MHLVIHTQYYPPEIGAPQARLSELGLHLREQGFEVTVLTALPSYPLGKMYPGYGGLLRLENWKDIPVIRCWIHPTQKVELMPRLLAYFSFVFSSLIVGMFIIRKFDIILTESPPLFLAISGYILCRLKGARWIFNVSDLWPSSALELGVIRPSSFGHRIGIWLEAFAYRKAWLVTGQSKEILADIRKRFPEVRTYHLSNGVDTQMFHPQEVINEDPRIWED